MYICSNAACSERAYAEQNMVHDVLAYVWQNKERFSWFFEWQHGITSDDIKCDERVLKIRTELEKWQTTKNRYLQDTSLVLQPDVLVKILSTVDDNISSLNAQLESLISRLAKPLPKDGDIRGIAAYCFKSITLCKRKSITLTFHCDVSWRISAKTKMHKAFSFLPLAPTEEQALPSLAQSYHQGVAKYVPWQHVGV